MCSKFGNNVFLYWASPGTGETGPTTPEGPLFAGGTAAAVVWETAGAGTAAEGSGEETGSVPGPGAAAVVCAAAVCAAVVLTLPGPEFTVSSVTTGPGSFLEDAVVRAGPSALPASSAG